MRHPTEDFDQLRSLLSCKRLEQPPPGYFRDFSDALRDQLESLPPPPPPTPLERLASLFELRPVLVAAYGLVLCGGVLFGARFAQVLSLKPLPVAVGYPWVEYSPPLAGRINGLEEKSTAAGVPQTPGSQTNSSASLLVPHRPLTPVQRVTLQIQPN